VCLRLIRQFVLLIRRWAEGVSGLNRKLFLLILRIAESVARAIKRVCCIDYVMG
jgi:hypothetical protein